VISSDSPSEPYALAIDAAKIARLRELRAEAKFADLPGYDTVDEQLRCTRIIDELLDRLIEGVEANRRRSWVLEQFMPTLRAACNEDTEARERFGPYMERVMDILGIKSSEGMLTAYLTFGGVGAA
jgi:Domain of unknown function (DUF4844)